MKWVLIGLAGIALAGCNTTGTSSPAPSTAEAISAPDLPADFRQQIVLRAKAEFFDPYSVRDAGIAPTPIIAGSVLTGSNAIICVRANAKNRMGGYTGLKSTSYIFKAGLISMVDQQYAAMTCASAVFEPFPELEAGYTPPAAPAKRSPRKPAT